MNQADEDFSEELYHRREWVVQRIGWIAMALFLVAAVLGVFGDGPLSSAVVQDSAGNTLRYDRFTRHLAPTTFEIHAAASTKAPELRIRLSQNSAETFSVESITPQPTRTEIVSDQHSYFFADRGSAATIVFHLDPQRVGSQRTIIQIDAGSPLEIHQFTYP